MITLWIVHIYIGQLQDHILNLERFQVKLNSCNSDFEI
jgi:hypothetical protein